ncbi:MAG: hypothetical protein M1450_03435 [Patescibacteria group bacterium]|nr:hypothetical protein [Patescibacteria group bacterium]
MDPKKQLTNLDPKLKETYDRVMGMNLSSSPQPPPPQPTQPAEVPKPPPAPKQPSSAVGVVTSIHTEEMKQMVNPQSTAVLKPGLSPTAYLALVVGGLIFFVIYTILWLKHFNVPIPFLPGII